MDSKTGTLRVDPMAAGGVFATEIKTQELDVTNARGVYNSLVKAYGKDTPGLDDEDIVDALGIGLWYYKTGGH